MENKEKMYEEGLDETIAFIDRLVEIAEEYGANTAELVFQVFSWTLIALFTIFDPEGEK